MKLDIPNIKRKILPILKPYEVERVGLFGSSVKGKMTETSDIDILVDIKRDISLLEFVDLKLKLEEVLGKAVDLVEYQTIKPALRQQILKEQIQIL